MHKGYVRDLIETWLTILADVSRTFPTLEAEFGRDQTRLLRAVEQRGIRVLLVDLPAIAKHFDRCLAGGEYRLPGLPLTKRYSSKVQIPKFLRGLYLLVFHSSGRLKEVPDVAAIRAFRQLTKATSKLKIPCPAEAEADEVVGFYSRDLSLPSPESFWGGKATFHACDDARAVQNPTGCCSVSNAGCGSESIGTHLAGGPTDLGFYNPRFGESPSSASTSLEEARALSDDPRAFALGKSGGHVDPSPQVDPTTFTDQQDQQSAKCARGSGSTGLGSAFEVVRRLYEGFAKSPVYRERLVCHTPGEGEWRSDFLAKLDRISSYVTSGLGSYDPSEWRFRHGPGVVSNYRGPANKYCWTNWSERLEQEFPIADYGFHNYSAWVRHVQNSQPVGSKEPASRLFCVPKDFTKPRLIAAEPSEHQWCQQNLWHYFCSRTHRSWIGGFVRFHDQSLNQELCLKGSRDGSLATIDLSNASDLVSCHAVGQLFRGNPRLLSCLAASRTRFMEQNVTDRVPSMIELRKFSTMGNACTFPVESLLFLSVALAAVLTQRKEHVNLKSIKRLQGEVSVFGDDIIVPADSRKLVVEALELLHLEVNHRKTFGTGLFRESCGVDAFAGSLVTPAYVRTLRASKPESLASTVETSNNLYKGGWYLTADLLASTLPRGIATTDMGSGVFGLRSLLGYSINGLPTRWNRVLQRHEVRILTPIGSQERTPIEDDSAMLQYFTEDPSPLTMWRSGVPQRPRLKIRPRWVPIDDLRTKT